MGSNGFSLTSVWAFDGGTNAMQAGVVAIKNIAIDNAACSYNDGSIHLIYFTETVVNGTYFCYNEGNAGYGNTNVFTLLKDTTGHWIARRGSACLTNPSGNCVSMTFPTTCNTGACRWQAFAEHAGANAGDWKAKFSGSGYTPWQRYTTQWYTVQSNYTHTPGTGWTWNSGPFPNGLWNFTYHQ